MAHNEPGRNGLRKIHMSTKTKTQVIIAAAGEGTRLKAQVPKAFVLVNGRALLTYSLDVFEASPLVDSVILVVPPAEIVAGEKIIGEAGFKKIKQVIAGGKTRTESVANGLNALDADTQYVAIHDGARPLVSLRIVEEALRVCYDGNAVIVAVPVKPTIKRVNAIDSTVVETIDRRDLWEVQTPQVFAKDLIVRAHAAASADATDDAVLVERLGERVKVVMGDYENFKVTTPEDLVIVESLLRKRK